jgi:hypothetical protein
MATKRFDKELHDIYDKMGRDIVKDFVSLNWGIEARCNPKVRGIDLLLYTREGALAGYAEVEVRLSWKTLEFPYADLNVPERKRKLLNQDLPTFFFSINKDGTALFHCGSDVVLKSKVEEVRNKHVFRDEQFFKVPLDKLNYVILQPST